MLTAHQNETASNGQLKPLLRQLRESLQHHLLQRKDKFGFNKVALTCLQEEWKEKHTGKFAELSLDDGKAEKKAAKRQEKRKRVIAIH